MTGWRAMALADMDRIMAVADSVHLDYPERPEVFAERLALFPDGCRVALAVDGIVGYGVMHPVRAGHPPALDSLLDRLPTNADALYLHDIALLPPARGLGLGESVLAYARGLAIRNGYARLALTSTPPARGYWLRHGFSPCAGSPELAAKLASYGAGMTYMELAL